MDRPQRRFGSEVETILSQVSTAIKKIHDLGYNIFVTMHCGVDYQFTKFLYEQNFFDYETIDMIRMSPLEIIEFYRKMDLVIGSRGHASMIPFGVGTKIISIGGHPKVKSFLDDIDALDWFVDIANASEVAEKLLQTFDAVIADDTITERINRLQNKLWTITVENVLNIRKMINNAI